MWKVCLTVTKFITQIYIYFPIKADILRSFHSAQAYVMYVFKMKFINCAGRHSSALLLLWQSHFQLNPNQSQTTAVISLNIRSGICQLGSGPDTTSALWLWVSAAAPKPDQYLQTLINSRRTGYMGKM